MREDVERWLKFAEMDLRVSRLAFENKIYIYSAYHAQQAVEKYLKAFLISKDQPYPRTHDIKFLIYKCMEIDESFRQLLDMDVDKLTIYATGTRYPEYEFEVTDDMAREALEKAEKVRVFILGKLGVREVKDEY